MTDDPRQDSQTKKMYQNAAEWENGTLPASDHHGQPVVAATTVAA